MELLGRTLSSQLASFKRGSDALPGMELRYNRGASQTQCSAPLSPPRASRIFTIWRLPLGCAAARCDSVGDGASTGTFYAAPIALAALHVSCIRRFVPEVTLTDDELRDVCIALRGAAHRAMEVAVERKSDSHISQSFASDRRRYEDIAEKLDAVRERGRPAPSAQGAMNFLGRS
jgi:hypothetical protein